MLNLIAWCCVFAAWLCLAGGAWLANRKMMHPLAGLLISLSGGLLGGFGLAAAVGAISGEPSVSMMLAGLLALPPILFPLSGFLVSLRFPMINDISTDLLDPPGFQYAGTLPENAGRNLDFPGRNAGIIRKGYPDLGPLLLEESPEKAYARALDCAATEMPRWRITSREEAALTFEGVAETRLFHFQDDFVVRVRPGDAGGSRVDMRSKSRHGKNDFGANAARISAFFRQLDLQN